MAKRIDPRYFNNFIDANVLDRMGDGHDDAVDEMLSLYERSEITLLLPSHARGRVQPIPRRGGGGGTRSLIRCSPWHSWSRD